MPSIHVDGAAARLLATGALAKAGLCLHYCWLAISQGKVHYITGGADTAYNTWLAVPADQRHSSRTVPKDFPAFLGKKFLSSAGDVIISNGDGTFTATDWPKSKQVGICTLEQREKQTGRKFVGWASSMGGHQLVSTTSTASLDRTLITEQEDIMPHAIVNEEQGSKNFANIAVVTGNGELHIVTPTDRPWWDNLAACYEPTLKAKSVTEAQYVTFLAANQPRATAAPAGVTGVAVEQIVKAAEGRIIKAIPTTFRAGA